MFFKSIEYKSVVRDARGRVRTVHGVFNPNLYVAIGVALGAAFAAAVSVVLGIGTVCGLLWSW